MYLICHVTSHDHPIESSWKIVSGGSLCYVATLINLVTIVIVMMKIGF